jgi:hypothetical protein
MTDNVIDKTEALKFAHNMFTDEAQRFYTSDSSILSARSVTEINQLMIERLFPQLLNPRYLVSWTICQSRTITKDGLTPREALDALYNTIVKRGV